MSEQYERKKQEIDVHKTIFSALNQMKQNVNKNQHLQESLRKYLLSPNNKIKIHKFEIEQIYSKDNTKSQLKHAIPTTSLNAHRRQIKNTFKAHDIKTDYDFSEEQPFNIQSLTHSQNFTQVNTIQQNKNVKHNLENFHSLKYSQSPTQIPSHPSSANTNKRQSNFFLTSPSLAAGRISFNSLKLKAKDKAKTQVSCMSETQTGSPQNTSRLQTTQFNTNSQQVISINQDRLNLDSSKASPQIQPQNKAQNTTNSFNLRLIQGNVQNTQTSSYCLNTNHNNQITSEQENFSLLSTKNIQLSSSNLINTNQNLNYPTKQFKSIPASPKSKQISQLPQQNRHSENNQKQAVRASSAQHKTLETLQIDEDQNNLYRFSYEMNEQEIEEDNKTPLLSVPNIQDAINEENQDFQKNQEEEELFVAQPQQFYYIDNNEMQSVKEFMYRLNNYMQYKRFEQYRQEKKQKKKQIEDVQNLLLFNSEKAAREVAKANVRKYIIKHKIEITDQEIDDWVERIKVLPLEKNQRLTFRECSRQIISFQLMGTDEEKKFFKVWREIDKGLNKISNPIKFAQQYQIYQNHKKRLFYNKNITNNQISMAIINSLPSQYLIHKPPPSFFQQNSQSMNRISSQRSIAHKDLSLYQIQHQKEFKVVESLESEEF
ncbi:hypothetical protein TTHERM_01228930 (macronuclear) [Tetrahymena thermophila SB210]|uniref:Uncharacterized protein n=1 Tax=Tetrahymena thermophila (strain SB210) TaxID=312017 RepID=Q22AG6_TETTS|nr:hypothetical protein TTHERM_01228930 [Tetrahymena thermophila SB210]EAR82276.2 hypothetical protein TTHERM_01228930 [Tetrahymena thermophila SB210]|eukprot:XP_001029939.2 hypothetical protein TTHERM_01228930 [Tetrahymena thermophila SB210]